MSETANKTSAKDKILESAEELILLGGYHGTGTNAIIKKASVSKGSFFYHFPDKKSLGVELIRKYASESLLDPLKRNLETFPHSPKKGLICFVDELEAYFADDGYTGGCLLGNLALELSDSEPEIRQEIEKSFAEWRTVLLKALEQTQLIMDKDHFISLFIASLEGIAMTIKAHKSADKAAQEFEAIRTLVNIAAS